jgi:branched-chain amino acid transport system substrate-binding protein
VKVLGAEPSHHAAKSYGGLLAVADAIKKANSTDREAIRKSLREVKLMTAFGPVSFEDKNGFTNQNPAPSLVIQVQKGKFVVVWPKESASGEPLYPTPPWEKRQSLTH